MSTSRAIVGAAVGVDVAAVGEIAMGPATVVVVRLPQADLDLRPGVHAAHQLLAVQGPHRDAVTVDPHRLTDLDLLFADRVEQARPDPGLPFVAVAAEPETAPCHRVRIRTG